MIKIIKIRSFPNLGSGCVCILNYVYTQLKPCVCIPDDLYASFNTELKNHIFIDLIIQGYKHKNQTSMLETLKTKLT